MTSSDYEVSINDESFDLYPDTVIGVTLQANDVGIPGSIVLNYTNQFKLPFTEKNDRLIQYARDIRSRTASPYVNQFITVKVKGVEIIVRGMMVIKKSTASYEIVILSKGADFFSFIKDRRLCDLDFSAYNGPFNQVDSDDFALTTSGIVVPVLDYGDFDKVGYQLGTTDSQTVLPSVYVHTIIDQIFIDAGYTKSGNLFTNAKYLKMIVPYSRPSFEYDPSFAIPRRVSARVTGGQSIVDPVVATGVEFATLVTKGDIGYWDNVSKYLPNDPAATTGYPLFLTFLSGGIDITVVGGTVDIIIHAGGTLSPDTTIFTNVGTGFYPLSDASLINPNGAYLAEDGDSIEVQVIKNSGTPTVTVNSGSLKIEPSLKPFAYGIGYTYFNQLLPDMTQTDFLKEIMSMFGQLCVEINGVIVFKGIDEVIVDTANALDWSNKRSVSSKDDVSYLPLLFTWASSDEWVNKEFGSYSMLIDNETIASNKTITFKFRNSTTEFLGDILMGRIKVWTEPLITNDVYEFDSEPGLRIMLVRAKYSYEPSVYYSEFISVSDYLVAYFDDPDQQYTMRLEQFFDDHYPVFTEILQKAKLVTREYNLTSKDIADITFLVPIHDTDSDFLIRSVGPFRPGKLTKVQLLKI